MGPRRGRLAVLAVTAAASILAGCSHGGGRSATTTSTSAPVATSTTAVATTTGPPTTGTAGTTATTTAVATTTTVAEYIPPQVTGLTVAAGGGSGEVDITWPPLPAAADIASYKLYKRRADGVELPPATVTSATLGNLLPGRLGLTDAPDFGPWPSMEPDPGPRCYKVTAVSTGGAEGPSSDEACGSPVGG